jgi:hypothetical protein
MDLANQALEFLKPHVLAAGGVFADKALIQAGVEVGRVYGWLKSKLTRPTAAAALQQATAVPQDKQNWDDLRRQLEILLKDESLREELGALLPKGGGVRTTNQTIAQTGNQNAAAQVTGNRNSTNIKR